MNDAEKMREAFEDLFIKGFAVKSMADECLEKLSSGEYKDQITYAGYEGFKMGWQAATEQQDERIKDLEAQIEHQRAMLSKKSL